MRHEEEGKTWDDIGDGGVRHANIRERRTGMAARQLNMACT